jgi:hypothetical protein
MAKWEEAVIWHLNGKMELNQEISYAKQTNTQGGHLLNSCLKYNSSFVKAIGETELLTMPSCLKASYYLHILMRARCVNYLNLIMFEYSSSSLDLGFSQQ